MYIRKQQTTLFTDIPISSYLMIFTCSEEIVKQILKRCKLIGVKEDF